MRNITDYDDDSESTKQCIENSPVLNPKSVSECELLLLVLKNDLTQENLGVSKTVDRNVMLTPRNNDVLLDSSNRDNVIKESQLINECDRKLDIMVQNNKSTKQNNVTEPNVMFRPKWVIKPPHRLNL